MEINNKGVSPIPEQEIPHVSKFTVGEPEKKKNLLPIVIGAVFAVIVFLVVWFLFINKPKSANVVIEDSTGTSSDSEAFMREGGKVISPITGVKYPESEAVAWADQRPLGVMINNHVDARPQSGLIYADIVYEVVAEGGITRFLAFYLTNTPDKIGPVRSTREYYLVLVKELGDAMIMHIGWSPQALEAIETWPVRSLARGGGTFWRDNPRNVAIEHTAYVDAKALRKVGFDIGWEGFGEFDVWKFKDDQTKYAQYPDAKDITIDFWYEGDYSSIFKYDPQNNSYLRFMGYDDQGEPAPHKDQETGEQINFKNVIVQFAAETAIEGDDKSRLEYQLVGSGSGLVFLDGKVVEVTWTKESRDARTTYYDQNGQEMEFNRGQFWVSIVPDRNVEQVVFN